MNDEYFELADRLAGGSTAEEISEALSVDIRRYDRKFTETEEAV